MKHGSQRLLDETIQI